MDSDLLHGFYLDNVLVEPLKGQVLRDGEPVHLPPKAMEVLLNLASRPTRLVTREALLERVWGAGQGSPEALGRAVSEIRHALGDYPENPRFVQTLPGLPADRRTHARRPPRHGQGGRGCRRAPGRRLHRRP